LWDLCSEDPQLGNFTEMATGNTQVNPTHSTTHSRAFTFVCLGTCRTGKCWQHFGKLFKGTQSKSQHASADRTKDGLEEGFKGPSNTCYHHAANFSLADTKQPILDSVSVSTNLPATSPINSCLTEHGDFYQHIFLLKSTSLRKVCPPRCWILYMQYSVKLSQNG
ncbi:hypothetical protein ATANTOWER_000635, partial [Ataeniobius toweri]|nr:hypothetical protein [Ataeniobius toweri]